MLSYLKNYIKCDHEHLVIHHVSVCTERSILNSTHPSPRTATNWCTDRPREFPGFVVEGTPTQQLWFKLPVHQCFSQQPSELGSHFCWIHAVHRRRKGQRSQRSGCQLKRHNALLSQLIEASSRSHLPIMIINTRVIVLHLDIWNG